MPEPAQRATPGPGLLVPTPRPPEPQLRPRAERPPVIIVLMRPLPPPPRLLPQRRVHLLSGGLPLGQRRRVGPPIVLRVVRTQPRGAPPQPRPSAAPPGPRPPRVTRRPPIAAARTPPHGPPRATTPPMVVGPLSTRRPRTGVLRPQRPVPGPQKPHALEPGLGERVAPRRVPHTRVTPQPRPPRAGVQPMGPSRRPPNRVLDVQRVHRHLALRKLTGAHQLRQLPVGLQMWWPNVPGRTPLRKTQARRTVARSVLERLLPLEPVRNSSLPQAKHLTGPSPQPFVPPPLGPPPLWPP